MNSIQTSTIVQMLFDVAILVAVIVCTFLHIIPNDLLLLALGMIIRGGFSIAPSIAAVNQNTAATQQNTAVVAETTGIPTMRG